MKKILICNYLFLDEHLCAISRIELLRAFKKLNYKTFLYAQTLSTRFTKIKGIDKIYVDRVSSNKFFKYLSFFIQSIFRVPFIIFFKKINLIIIDPYSLFPILPSIILSKIMRTDKIFILDFRSGIFHEKNSGIKNIIRNYYLKIFMNLSSLFINYRTYISRGLKSHIENKYGKSKSQSLIWSSGISQNFLVKDLTNKKRTDKLKLIYHGSIGIDRGLTEIIEAINNLDNIELKIIGSDSNKKTVNKIKALIKTYKLSNVFVQNAIPQAQILDEIIEADVGLVLLSNTLPMRTSSPLKLLEYLSLNKIILSTKLESIESVVKCEKSGIVFIDNNSPYSIINGLKKIINNYDNLIIDANNGRSIVMKKYTWDQQAINICNYIEGN